jgi:NADH-quinone oxidoreductase subunit G
LKINGMDLDAEPGQTIMKVAEKAGIEIPHFCYHPELSISGNCRMCLVEIEKNPKLQIACGTAVADGMIVRTDTAQVKSAQKDVLEFLLINHPVDCPICDQAGECKLQDYYMKYGLYRSRMKESKVLKRKAVKIGGGVMLDSERCVLCSRCIRFLNEIARSEQLCFFNRGGHTEIGTFPGRSLDGPYTVNTADVCPVGALTSSDFRFKCRSWLLKSTSSICPGCGTGCNIILNHHTNCVCRIKPRDNPFVNRSWLCNYGRLTHEPVSAPDRITTAMVRDGGELKRAHMADAVKRTAGIISEAVKSGKEVGMFASASCSNEDLFIFGKFLKVVGGGRVRVVVPKRDGWAGDSTLMDAHPAANRQGAMDMGCEVLGAEEAGRLLSEGGLSKAGCLIAVGVDLPKPAPGMPVIYIGTNEVETMFASEIVIPQAAFAEISGSFTNRDGRVQRLNPAFPPAGDASPGWLAIAMVAASMGHNLRAVDANEIFMEIANSVGGYSGMTLATLGEMGRLKA